MNPPTNAPSAFTRADAGSNTSPTRPTASEERPEIELRPLAPEYVPAQHATYVRHLVAAVSMAEVRNIALTGRYGSGKSSILDEFLRRQQADGRRTLRISINTLGPDDNEDITNRIQKELVKQLVYRAGPGEVRRSRFVRSKDLTWRRTLRDAGVVAAVLLVLLRLFGVWPTSGSLVPGSGELGVGVVFVLAVLAGCWIVRALIGDRLLSEVSTGSASVTLEAKPDSYFDKYLDEIMAFFDATTPDVVVFEDLDRFDDARIFDSLRELNTLINASALRTETNNKLIKNKKEQRPLRFVYAIKDSLFERLGDASSTDTDNGNLGDTADKAVERANRTKFFEVVIPVVPFLSHGNARDLLVETVDRLGLPKGTMIDRRLLDTVGSYATDMRLLLNICNEFVVFAERLLWVDRPAPGITATALFALVAYKNFHLTDFERLPQRGSALDCLETKRQEVVRSGIEGLQRTRRELHRDNDLQRNQVETAKQLGDRLLIARNMSHAAFLHFEVGDQQHSDEHVHTTAFWQRVIAADQLGMVFQISSPYQGITTTRSVIDHDQLMALFPEAMSRAQWQLLDDAQLATRRTAIDRHVAQLRGAGFGELARITPATDGGEAFAEIIEEELSSQLARDLVRRGFIDRYYAEYAAAFYGGFLGVDVANYFRNSIWPNAMAVDARFTTNNAVSNILEQAPDGFTSSRSAFNIEIVDHLIEHDQDRARKVVAFFVAEQSEDAHTFLDAFLNDTDASKRGLVALLAAHPWRGILNHLTADSLPDETTRTELLDAALSAADSPVSYDLNEATRALIVERHQNLKCFTEVQEVERAAILLAFVQVSGLRVPNLQVLAEPLRAAVIANGAYALTAGNLRTALGLRSSDPLELEKLHQDDNVRRRCMEEPDGYLEAVEADDATPYAVLTSDALCDLILEQHEAWSDEQLQRLLALSAPESALPDLAEVPKETWPAIAAARVVVLNAPNACAYASLHGIDKALAHLLADSGPGPLRDLETIDQKGRARLAEQILNAHGYFASVAGAVDIVKRLGLEQALDAKVLETSHVGMLPCLLTASLVPDAPETFAHFLTAGWPAVAEAFAVSTQAISFLTPDLVSGVLAELLNDSRVPDPVKRMVVENLSSFIPESDAPALRAASKYAHTKQILLPINDLRRLASTAQQSEPEALLWQLSQNAELSAQQILDVLPRLGGEYAAFAGGPGRTFEVPAGASMKSILGRLRTGGLVELPGRESRGRKKVTSLV